MLRSTFVTVSIALVSGACSNTSGCGVQPLPGGALPADQTLEGGAQIRVTQQGFAKLTSVVPGLLNAQFANGFCVPEGSQYSVDYCYETQSQCAPGCKVTVGVNQTTFSATNSQTLTIALDINADSTVPTDAPFFSPCYIYVDGNNLRGNADIELTTDAATGELRVRLARIRDVDLSGLNFSGSGGFCSGASSFADFLKDYFAQQIVDYLTPRLNDLVQDFIPNPLGLVGLIDATPLVANISPGTKGSIEARIVPGGFVALDASAQGLSLGVITGINSDEDIATRSPQLDGEPALCVPPVPAPNYGAPPHSLNLTARSTYALPLAPAFAGMPDPAGSDLSIGLSETSLDLIGHHAVTSGLMCLGIGTRVVPQLDVATFGLLVPSVADLASEDGHDPILLVTRPQRPVDFTLGDNTAQSPALTVTLDSFEIDVYPFLYERYTRAFTIVATLDLGINFEFDQPTGGPWRVKPMLVGLTANDVAVSVINNQFIKESRTQLEMALPPLFDLLAQQISIRPIDLPTFAGFDIVDPRISHVTSGNDDFLALHATLSAGMPFQQVALHEPMLADAIATIDASAAPRTAPASGRARVREVFVPPPADIRAALAGTGGAMPRVTIDVDARDERGRMLEWSWRIGNGLWRPYSAARPLVIADRSFAWQGTYTIGLMSRVVGQPATASDETVVAVAIDSVGPNLVTSKMSWDDDVWTVPGWDLVSGRAVRISFGRPGDDEPRTPWQTGGTAKLDRTAVDSLLIDGELVVFLEDARGNQTIALVAPFHGQPGQGGCNCETGGGSTGALFALLVLGVVARVSRWSNHHRHRSCRHRSCRHRH